jgi:hypothetical protein
MHTRSKLLLAAASAAVVLAALVSTTSANRFALRERTFRATWSSIALVSGLFGTVKCLLTIEGSFHSRTVSKIAESLAGYVTRSTIAETQCTGGHARILGELLPWHIRYNGFSGVLPQITSIEVRIVGSHFLVESANVFCLYASTAASPIKDIINRNTMTNAATSIRVNEPSGIPLSSGNSLCPRPATLQGTSNTLTILGSTEEITVILVQ